MHFLKHSLSYQKKSLKFQQVAPIRTLTNWTKTKFGVLMSSTAMK